MKEAEVVSSYKELQEFKIKPFLLYSQISKNNAVMFKNMVAYKEVIEEKIKFNTPSINLSLEEVDIKLKENYSIADFNTQFIDGDKHYYGIKPGSDVTIYVIPYHNDDFSGLKGYELYPGTPAQYLNFLSSPYIYYMIYVRFFIGIALLLFLLSMVINIRK